MPTPQTFMQGLARRLMIGTCGVLALGMVGAVSVRGGSSDEQVIHVREEPVNQSADAAEAMPVRDAEPLLDEVEAPVQLASTAVQPAMRIRVVRMLVTAYCPCTICCGPKAHGITASGKPVSYNGGHFVAADTRLLPFGTKLMVPGYDNDQPIPVIDRGGAIKGNRLDVFFPTHEQALEWGRRWVMVTVME